MKTNRKITRMLKVVLTKEEMLGLSKQTAEESFAMQDLEHQFESVRADFKGRISTYEALVNRGMRIIRDGYEMRDVDCEVRYHDPGAKHKSILRMDTFEVVESGKMSESECQEQLPFEEPG